MAARRNLRALKLQSNLAGISQNRDERFLNPSEAQDIVNMHSLKDGTWSADKAGYDHLNGTAVESGAVIDGVHWFTAADGTDYLLVAANGKLKQVNVSTGAVTDADASAGYTAGQPVDFQNFNDLVYTCDGTIATPRKWDGSTGSNAGGWPVSDTVNSFDTPKYVELHQNRTAWSGFSSFPNHIVVSDQNAGETFTQPATTAADSFIAEVSPGDGGVITGMRSIPIPNSNDDALVIFKNRGIYTMYGASAWSGDEDRFRIIRNNPDFGAFNNRCIVHVGSDLLALNEYGIISYSSSNTSGTIQPVGISVNRIRDVIDKINPAEKSKCWGIHLKDRREIWWGIPTGSSTQVNEFIVYKYPDPGEPESPPRWSRRTGFTAAHGALYNKTFYIGTYAGFVGHMFNASQYNGSGIAWKYEFPYWDMGDELRFKRILVGKAHFRVRGDQSITMKTQWKGGGNNDLFSQSLQVTTTVAGAVYGTAVYGTDFYGVRDELSESYNVPGNGTRIKHTLSGTTTTSGPEFLGLSVIREPGGLAGHWN